MYGAQGGDTMQDWKKDMKVIKEAFSESKTDSLETSIHKRVLQTHDGLIKLTIEAPEEFEELFATGETLSIEVKNPQKKLGDEP